MTSLVRENVFPWSFKPCSPKDTGMKWIKPQCINLTDELNLVRSLGLPNRLTGLGQSHPDSYFKQLCGFMLPCAVLYEALGLNILQWEKMCDSLIKSTISCTLILLLTWGFTSLLWTGQFNKLINKIFPLPYSIKLVGKGSLTAIRGSPEKNPPQPQSN